MRVLQRLGPNGTRRVPRIRLPHPGGWPAGLLTILWDAEMCNPNRRTAPLGVRWSERLQRFCPRCANVLDALRVPARVPLTQA